MATIAASIEKHHKEVFMIDKSKEYPYNRSYFSSASIIGQSSTEP